MDAACSDVSKLCEAISSVVWFRLVPSFNYCCGAKKVDIAGLVFCPFNTSSLVHFFNMLFFLLVLFCIMLCNYFSSFKWISL